MLESSVRCTRGLLIHPFETFEKLKTATLTETYRYYVLLLILYSILIAVVSIFTIYMTMYSILIHYSSIPLIGSFFIPTIGAFRSLLINWSIFFVYLSFFFMLFVIFIKGFFIHTFVILLGGEQGIVKTIQTLMYASTPFFLFGWIPYIGLLGIAWAIILCVIGLIVLQELQAWKAVLVVLIPAVLMIIGLITGIIMITSLIPPFFR